MSSLSQVVTLQSVPPSAPEAALAYLRHHDDPMRWEAPRMFNRCAELRRMQRFVASLEGSLERRLDHELGAGLGDAAFHGEVFLEGASIRFSNFGRMIAILDGDHLTSSTRRFISQVADEHAYILIPEALLGLPYARAQGYEPCRETWGSRFFGAP